METRNWVNGATVDGGGGRENLKIHTRLVWKGEGKRGVGEKSTLIGSKIFNFKKITDCP